MTADAFPPGLILILAAVPAALLRGRLRQAWMLLVPALSLCNMLALPDGNHFLLPFFRQELVLARVDRHRVAVGSPALLQAQGVSLGPLEDSLSALRRQGKTAVAVAVRGILAIKAISPNISPRVSTSTTTLRPFRFFEISTEPSSIK